MNNVAGILGLDRVLSRSPSALSGGERQRVAIGRALVREPRIVLLDEPFSNLDVPLRAALREEVIELHRRFKTTLIHVTHDQSEALFMGDRVVILEARAASPVRFSASDLRPAEPPIRRHVRRQPADESLAVSDRADGRDHEFSPDRDRESGGWTEPARSLPRGWEENDAGLRPGNSPGGDLGPSRWMRDRKGVTHTTAMTARVRRLEFNGPDLLATLAVGPHRLIARLPTNQALEDRQRVEVVLDLSKSVWFDQTTGEAIPGG